LLQFAAPQQRVTICDGLCHKGLIHIQALSPLSQAPIANPLPSDIVHVLVVDDEPRVRKMLTDYLTDQNMRVSAAANGAEMWACLEKARIDVVLLDLVLPGEDGVTIAAELRRRRADLGIIMLTGRADVVDRVVGLEVGADDYLTKPFHLREVLARIKSVARRARAAAGATAKPGPDGGNVLRFGDWRLNIDQRKLLNTEGQEVALTTGEFNLLAVFAEHPNRVLDRDTLMDLAKGRQWEALDRSVDSQVARLRRKIEPDPSSPTLIRSVRGVGYLFAAEVTRG
jgi:two-component system phosphate regulon response regulator OmpR